MGAFSRERACTGRASERKLWKVGSPAPLTPRRLGVCARDVALSLAGKLFYKDHRNKCTAWDNPLLRPNYFRQFDKAQVYSPGWELVIDPATGKHLYFNHFSNVLYGL